MLIPAGETKTVRLVAETSGHAAVGGEYPIRVGIGEGTIWVYVKITKTHSGEVGTLEATVVDKEGNVVKGADVAFTTVIPGSRGGCLRPPKARSPSAPRWAPTL